MELNPVAVLARSIAVALNSYADSVSSPNAQVSSVAQTVTAPAPSPQQNVATNVGASTTASQGSTGSAPLTVVVALEQGLKLTGKELDENGLPHFAEVNTGTPSVTKKNIWKKKVGLSADEYSAFIEAKKAEFAAVPLAPTGGIPTPAPTGGIPMPGTSAPTGGMPMPGAATHDTPHPLKKDILDEVNKLTKDLEVDYDVVLELMGEYGATDGTFATVPTDQYPALLKSLVGWVECLRLIANVTVECLSLNGNNQAVIVEHIYNAGQFGCTDATLVNKHDTWRLYEKLAEYRGALQTHFQQAVTPLAANPYL